MAAGLALVSSRFRGLVSVRVPVVHALLPGLAPVQTRSFSLNPDPNPELKNNPFYSKYEGKIQKLKSSDPEQFRSRVEKCSSLKQQKVGESEKQEEFIKHMERTHTPQDKSSNSLSGGGGAKHKSLDSILNVELVQDKSGDEIAQIWTQYFSTKDTISACIPTQIFDRIQTRAKACPTFLFALPRSDGYEFFVGQWAELKLHFTSLINLQTMGESAPCQLVLYHYQELKHKGIILMTAERERDRLGVHEAQCLANQVQLFYGSTDKAFRLVEAFNHQPKDFKHMDIIAELEQSGVGGI